MCSSMGANCVNLIEQALEISYNNSVTNCYHQGIEPALVDWRNLIAYYGHK
jgi:hypothetical protein